MELHTISPEGGYTQDDVMELAKIMTGWRPKWSKKLDNGGDIKFDHERHEPGKKNVLGKQYKSGSSLTVCQLPWGKVGLSICYDLRFPSIFRKLAKKGSDFLSIPAAFTKTTGKAHWYSLIRARAIENGCFVFAPAQCGTHDDGRKTYGHSLIVDPWGEVLAEAKNKPSVLTAKVDINLVNDARAKIPAMTNYDF